MASSLLCQVVFGALVPRLGSGEAHANSGFVKGLPRFLQPHSLSLPAATAAVPSVFFLKVLEEKSLSVYKSDDVTCLPDVPPVPHPPYTHAHTHTLLGNLKEKPSPTPA